MLNIMQCFFSAFSFIISPQYFAFANYIDFAVLLNIAVCNDKK